VLEWQVRGGRGTHLIVATREFMNSPRNLSAIRGDKCANKRNNNISPSENTSQRGSSRG